MSGRVGESRDLEHVAGGQLAQRALGHKLFVVHDEVMLLG